MSSTRMSPCAGQLSPEGGQSVFRIHHLSGIKGCKLVLNSTGTPVRLQRVLLLLASLEWGSQGWVSFDLKKTVSNLHMTLIINKNWLIFHFSNMLSCLQLAIFYLHVQYVRTIKVKSTTAKKRLMFMSYHKHLQSPICSTRPISQLLGGLQEITLRRYSQNKDSNNTFNRQWHPAVLKSPLHVTLTPGPHGFCYPQLHSDISFY